jgi:hypothetical protein
MSNTRPLHHIGLDDIYIEEIVKLEIFRPRLNSLISPMTKEAAVSVDGVAWEKGVYGSSGFRQH